MVAEELRAAVIRGLAAGRREQVTVEFGAALKRGRLVAADAAGIRVRVGALELPFAWSALAPRRFYGIARKYTADRKKLAAWCRAAGLAAEADALEEAAKE